MATVTPDKPANQPDPFAEIAAELRKTARAFETLVGSGLPRPYHFELNIQPGGRTKDDEVIVAAVDAMALALLGRKGAVEEMGAKGGGIYHYDATGESGPIQFSIYDGISADWARKHDAAAAAAALEAKEAELEKLRAEVAELRAAAAPGPFGVANWRAPLSDFERRAGVVDPSGLDYTRADTDADDPTPVSPARGPLHTGGVVDGGELVTDAETRHYEARGWKGPGPGGCGVECACGVGFDGFDTLAEAAELLAHHIADGNADEPDDDRACAHRGDGEDCECNGNDQPDETPEGRVIGRAPVEETPSEPVIRYFSFGHGQSTASGESLLDKYATVVAPTADACRAGMLAVHGRACSMEYEPGDERSDAWIAQWTEHERITVASVAECGCPVLAYPEGRGDKADTIVHHVDGWCAESPF